MSTTIKILFGIVGIVVVLGLWLSGSYNTLVSLEEGVDQSFADLATQYQRRFDLVPNLIATVKGAANFEQTTLQNVVAARSAWAQAGTTGQKVVAAGQFDTALSRLLVTVESYPTLTATQGYRDLMTQLEGTENRVAFARKSFNETATAYNKTVRRFPTNLIANVFSFETDKPLFAAESGSEKAPAVNFETPATAN